MELHWYDGGNGTKDLALIGLTKANLNIYILETSIMEKIEKIAKETKGLKQMIKLANKRRALIWKISSLCKNNIVFLQTDKSKKLHSNILYEIIQWS